MPCTAILKSSNIISPGEVMPDAILIVWIMAVMVKHAAVVDGGYCRLCVVSQSDVMSIIPGAAAVIIFVSLNADLTEVVVLVCGNVVLIINAISVKSVPVATSNFIAVLSMVNIVAGTPTGIK